MANKTGLKREHQSMPSYVEEALHQHGLMKDYLARPAYQRNDYLGWIKRAKQTQTREKRLQQMLDELQRGGVYMNMPHPTSRKS